MNEIDSTNMDAICEAIDSLPGVKIVTLYSPVSVSPVMKIDVNGTTWGYHVGHHLLFRAKMIRGGAITVRHFLDDRIEVEGRTIPAKNLYGVRFSEDAITPMDAEELEWCYEHVVEGGKSQHIGREPGVHYKPFADLLH